MTVTETQPGTLSLGTNMGCQRWLVTEPRGLPDLRNAGKLYIDVETKSGDPKRGGNMPYNGDRICGIAITVDDRKEAWYVPYRHRSARWNLPVEPVLAWIQEILATCQDKWINHNIKFDKHFLFVDGVEYDGPLACTLTLCKLIYTDRFDYTLKGVCRDWLHVEAWEKRRVDWMAEEGTKDFADVPADILGEYACDDIISNRALYFYCLKRLPSTMNGLWETEQRFTQVLWDMENRGLWADKHELQLESMKSLVRQVKAKEFIDEFVGWDFVDSNKHLQAALIGQLGLPVLKWNYKEGKRVSPCFDKDIWPEYVGHPQVVMAAPKRRLMKELTTFRKEGHFKGLFLDAWLKFQDDDGFIHAMYNQVIRTGRMSGHDPNPQQLNARGKGLVRPAKGRFFISADASQIEFRLIAHFCRLEAAIDAYAKDVNTDFHQWVTDLCHFGEGKKGRDAGKTMNFTMAYGAGEKKVTKSLANNEEIMRDVKSEIDDLVQEGKIERHNKLEMYVQMCAERASLIYSVYHQRLSGIKQTTNAAMKKCKARGYVFNPYGRRRYLPSEVSWKAFNSIAQGTAMDIIKETTVRLSPRFNEKMKGWDVWPAANVHDEDLFDAPLEEWENTSLTEHIDEHLSSPAVALRVPITWDIGKSKENWKEAVV